MGLAGRRRVRAAFLRIEAPAPLRPLGRSPHFQRPAFRYNSASSQACQLLNWVQSMGLAGAASHRRRLFCALRFHVRGDQTRWLTAPHNTSHKNDSQMDDQNARNVVTEEAAWGRRHCLDYLPKMGNLFNGNFATLQFSAGQRDRLGDIILKVGEHERQLAIVHLGKRALEIRRQLHGCNPSCKLSTLLQHSMSAPPAPALLKHHRTTRHPAPMKSWFIWALLSAVFAGATAVLAKVGVQGINSNVATAIRTTVVLVFAWLVAVPALRGAGLENIERRTWLFLTASGLATGLSWVCYFRALQLGNASQVAPVDKLSVVFAIGLAIIFLGERLTMRGAIGAVLIVAGVVLLALESPTPPPPKDAALITHLPHTPAVFHLARGGAAPAQRRI
jgi:transporter family protein